jgi:hypothetical protein
MVKPLSAIRQNRALRAAAPVGAMVGAAFGVTYGWITTKTMFRDSIMIMDAPVGQFLGYVGLAAVAIYGVSFS